MGDTQILPSELDHFCTSPAVEPNKDRLSKAESEHSCGHEKMGEDAREQKMEIVNPIDEGQSVYGHGFVENVQSQLIQGNEIKTPESNDGSVPNTVEVSSGPIGIYAIFTS